VTVVATRRAAGDATGGSALAGAMIAALRGAGHEVPPAGVEISSTLPAGQGLSSSAALEVALALALLALAGEEPGDTVEIAQLCQRVETRATGARTGLLDPLASLCGRRGEALRIDFSSLAVEAVPLDLDGWVLAVASSGDARELAASGYNDRRSECERACDLIGVETLRDARPADADALPEPLGRRVRHVIGENARVEQAVAALRVADAQAVARLLDASQASLRDLYDASTEEVERALVRLRDCGAAGARMMGGGFGGSVLGLFEPDVQLPDGVQAVAPAPGARLV
jgi:galactokinase